ECRLGSTDLLQRHTLFDEVLDAISNYRHHIAIVRDIARITKPPVARNDQCSALGAELRYGDLQDLVQAIEDAINAAALFEVDHRIACRRQDVSGADHVGVSEENHGVAVCVGGRRMKYLDAFAIEELAEFVGRSSIGYRRPGVGWDFRR